MMTSAIVLKRLLNGLGAVAAGWCLWTLSVEVRQAFAPEPPDPPRLVTARLWRLGDSPVSELEGFLTRVDRRIPESSVVAVTSKTGRGKFFFSTWCAFYLPRHDVVRAEHDWAWKKAGYLAAFGGPIEDPRLEELWRDPAGFLYEIRQPGEEATMP